MEQLDKGIGWLQKLLNLQKRYGFFSIIKGLFLLFLSGYIIFFALNPKYLSSDDVDAEYKEHEKEILLAQAKNDPKNANKPDEIIEKMITGRLNKELKEVCLLEQEYVKAENKENVKKYVESVAKAEGVSINLKSFVRFETGEGLEKKEEDFAAEVAAQMGN
jgi:elongation factor Ts